MSDSLRPHGIHQAPPSVGCSRQEYWSELPFPSPGDPPNPGIKPRSPTLQEDCLLAEPPGKPKNTGMGSLSLLQGIILTQKLNRGLLHCRRILYQLSQREAQENWSGLPIPSPADPPNPGIESGNPALQVDSLPTELSIVPLDLGQF